MPETVYLADYEKVFVGGVHAIGLSRRAGTDPHVIITIITEDDGHCFISESGRFSSAWLPGLLELMQETETWMKTYLLPDLDNGRQYGYKFKD